MTGSFDLDAYLGRIGYSGSLAPTAETLTDLHRRHVMTFPFENINTLMGWPVPLDIDSLQSKFVAGGRGGYCFEQNLLFKAALEAIGYKVTGLAARVLINRPPDSNPPRSHMLLRVDVDETPYIADTGFGGNTLTEPIRLEADTIQTTSHDARRLLAAEGEYTLQSQIRGEWQTLYRFGLSPNFLSDYEVSNWYICSHPDSHFTKGLVAARVTPTGRFALRNNEFAVHHLEGGTERRVLSTVSELRATLEEEFLLTLPESEELHQKLHSLTQSTPDA